MDKNNKVKFPKGWKFVGFQLYNPLYANSGGHCQWLPFTSQDNANAFLGQLPAGYVKRWVFPNWENVLETLGTSEDKRILKAVESLRFALEQIGRRGKVFK